MGNQKKEKKKTNQVFKEPSVYKKKIRYLLYKPHTHTPLIHILLSFMYLSK